MTINDKAAEILASTFLHYPLMKYAFDSYSEAQRKLYLEKLFTRSVNAASRYGGVIIHEEGDSALTWLPSTYFPLSLWNEIQSGMALIPLEVGIKSTLRLVNHDTVSESCIAKNAGPNMGYIWCIGVAENKRGRGYSRQLINKSIEQMSAQGLTEFWLKTDDAKNVAIYQKLGFEMMYHTVVKSSNLPTWVFKK